MTTPMDRAAENPFALTSAQREILDQADRFARRELHPLSERMDNEEWWPEDVFRKIGAAGFFGTTVPEAYGGVGLDLLACGVVFQAFARWNHAIALSGVAHDNLCLNNIYRNVFLDGLIMRQPHFMLLSAVAARVGVTRVVRPSGGFKLTELADLIESDWEQA